MTNALIMQNGSSSRWLAIAMAAVLCSGCAVGGGAEDAAVLPAKSFVVLALSRGKGVPTAAQAFFAKAHELLAKAKDDGADIAISRQRIGLEGESKLCVQFSDPIQGGNWFKKMQDLARGIDLINVAIEPCRDPP